MTDETRPILKPGPEHPIEIADAETLVRISASGHEIAAQAGALELREHVYPPVFYVNRDDLAAGILEASDRVSWCPYKGEARYFHLRLADGSRLVDAVWSYETPFDAVSAIRGRLGFYPDRVDVIPA